MQFEQPILGIVYGQYAIVVPSRILIALIGLAPLEENLNPLFFWYQPLSFLEFSIGFAA